MLLALQFDGMPMVSGLFPLNASAFAPRDIPTAFRCRNLQLLSLFQRQGCPFPVQFDVAHNPHLAICHSSLRALIVSRNA